MKKILVPIDGSECSNLAIDQADQLAKLNDSEIVLLHVDETPSEKEVTAPIQPGPGGMSPGVSGTGVSSAASGIPPVVIQKPDDADVSDASKNILNNASSRLHILQDKVTKISLRGKAADAIISYVQDSDIDLVIMGSSSKTGLKRFFLGSVSEKVAQSIEKSVMIIR